MNKIIALLKYQWKSYIRSNKFIMPLMVWLLSMGIAYSVAPCYVVSSFTFSMGILFFVMVWVGLSYTEIEDQVEEQLLLLKVQNEIAYYCSRFIFIFLVGIVFSIIGVLYPVIANLLQSNHLFQRPISEMDIVVALLLHIMGAFLGGLTGMLFHPRIKQDRKIAVLLAFFMALMSLVKGPIKEDLAVTKYITWIFPPVYDAMNCFANAEYFVLSHVAIAIGMIAIYCIALMLVQIFLLKKNKF